MKRCLYLIIIHERIQHNNFRNYVLIDYTIVSCLIH
uniref:Uncharacterized protein n=1 Tax=Anguilla anguilla TaxID=7936 RepID=A0A0E9P6T6_ANGAN